MTSAISLTSYLKSGPPTPDHVLDLGVEEAVGQRHRETLQ